MNWQQFYGINENNLKCISFKVIYYHSLHSIKICILFLVGVLATLYSRIISTSEFRCVVFISSPRIKGLIHMHVPRLPVISFIYSLWCHSPLSEVLLWMMNEAGTWLFIICLGFLSSFSYWFLVSLYICSWCAQHVKISSISKMIKWTGGLLKHQNGSDQWALKLMWQTRYRWSEFILKLFGIKEKLEIIWQYQFSIKIKKIGKKSLNGLTLLTSGRNN